MKCSIIIVNYRSRQHLEKCLDSIEKHLTKNKKLLLPFEVIVVNNDPESLAIDTPDHLAVRVIDLKKNVGFGRASNTGAKQAFGEYLFFLNPDTVLHDGSLRSLVYFLDRHQDVGVIGPKIFCLRRNASQPWTCGSKTDLLSILFRNTINKPWNKRCAVNVDWVSGTALLTRKSLFEAVGGFDEKFFMYFEDQDLCLRIKNLGKAVIYYPHTTIVHHDGKSWQKNSSKKSAYLKSQAYFFNKHHGQFQYFFLSALRTIIKGK